MSELQWRASTWEKLSLVHDKEAIELMKAKVSVFSDSVLCVGGIREFPESNKDWERRLAWFKSTHQHKELDGIDGKPVWSPEWMIFPGRTTLQILYEIQKCLATLGCEPKQVQRLITFMSIVDNIDWGIEDNKKVCSANSLIVGTYAKKFALGHWSFLGPGSKTTWYNTLKVKPGGQWDNVAELMMSSFQESGLPFFSCNQCIGTLTTEE